MTRFTRFSYSRRSKSTVPAIVCAAIFPFSGGHGGRDLTLRRRRLNLTQQDTSASNTRSVAMRIYYDIDLTVRTTTTRELHGEEIVRAGRYLIAKTLLALGAATVDPLSPANPIIFSAGPFSGTSFSNGNRTSLASTSPLTR